MPSPEPFRLWSAITAVSGVLERKVHTKGAAGEVYPNLFTLLVGLPASGKTVGIKITRDLWAKMQGLNLAPDNVTKASLIDVLSRSLRTIINGSTPYIFSSLCVQCSEFGVFFTHHDLEFLSVLTTIYDAPENYNEERRSTGVIDITKPHMVILAGTQPNFLSSFLPEEAWGQGFTSRLIMIYADASMPGDLFATKGGNRSSTLLAKLNEIFAYKGEFTWEPEAKEAINLWNTAGCPPVPTHSKLTIGYNGRRAIHAMKLSMISAASRCNGRMHVELEDFARARNWLLAAEKRMPDIFAAMGQKSDQQVLADLHFHLYRMWSSVSLDKRKPIPSEEIYKYLHSKVTSDKIAKLIEVAEKTGYIRKGSYPDEWIPCLRGGMLGTM